MDRFRLFMDEVGRLLAYERQQDSGFTLDLSRRICNEAEDIHDAMRCCDNEDGIRSALVIAARAFLLAEACGYAKPTPPAPEGEK